MADLNVVTISGRLTDDPELRQLPDGTFTCSFAIACNRRKDRDGNEKADFIAVVAWNSQAEFISRYFHKGKPIIVNGKLRTRTYKDKNDISHNVTEVIVNDVFFAGQTKEEKVREMSRGANHFSDSGFNADDFEEVSG